MRIAILSLPFRSNYGGIMQAFALQTILQRMGHEVIVLDKDMYHHRSWLRQQVSFGAYIVRKYFLHKEGDYYNLRRAESEHKIAETFIKSFVNSRLNIFRVKKLPRDFPSDIDAVVVGSDQVWRPKYFYEGFDCTIDNAFLSFLEGVPLLRISYSASFGTGEWEYSPEETDYCSRLIKQFDAVSVRETSAVAFCSEKLGRKDVCQMPDPTLVLSQDDYRSLFSIDKTDTVYLLYYILDETTEAFTMAEKIAADRGLTIKRINRDSNNPSKRARIKEPMEEWINDFANAAFVFTDSFHGCVFSIIFKKAFIAIGNKSRGMDRFTSLLATYHLENHLILSDKQYNPDCDYSVPAKTRDYLVEQRQQALDFLGNNLRKP